MAVPQFLAGPYNYSARSEIYDVQVIINDVYAAVTGMAWEVISGGPGGNLSVWTPERADYARFKIALTREDETHLTWKMYDHKNIEVSYNLNPDNNLMTISAVDPGTTVRYFCGPTYLYVINYHGTKTMVRQCILDNAPYASLIIPRAQYYWHNDNDIFSSSHAWDPSTKEYGTSAYALRRYANENEDQVFISLTGAYMSAPIDVIYFNTPAPLLGRMPQALLVDEGIADGTELSFPIDTGVSGTFVVCDMHNYGNMAIRKA